MVKYLLLTWVICMAFKKLDIIYEDKYIIAINKPTKLLTIASNKEKEKTLYHEVSDFVKKKHKSNKIFVVHRLDKDTSGVVLFAKDQTIKKELQDNWDKYALERRYISLVSGKVKEKEKTLKNKLVETKTNLVYVDDYSKLGKTAITKYSLINYVNNDSVLDIEILTGRKNQIRVQLSYINHPVVGDMKYGAKKSFYNRLMLHASKLVIIHPVTKEKLELIARNPKEFKTLF